MTELVRNGLPVCPHLSCTGSHLESVHELLQAYQELEIHQLLALRGDAPSGMGMTRMIHAAKLVAHIREHSENHFRIHVAAYPEIHPQAPGYDADIHFLKAKFEAGADAAITQYFYNPEAYFRFIESCAREGINQPIIPGIMPIHDYARLRRFSQACGAEIPRWLDQRLASYAEDSQSLRAFGLDAVTRLCEQLLAGGAPGLHFYTLNQEDLVLAIHKRLGLAAAET